MNSYRTDCHVGNSACVDPDGGAYSSEIVAMVDRSVDVLIGELVGNAVATVILVGLAIAAFDRFVGLPW